MTHDDELDNLRREAEREALTVALQMLRSPATPATARASVVRGVLGDAATRRNDEPLADKNYGSMTAAELTAAQRALRIQLARSNATPLELEAVADKPVGADVFD